MREEDYVLMPFMSYASVWLFWYGAERFPWAYIRRCIDHLLSVVQRDENGVTPGLTCLSED